MSKYFPWIETQQEGPGWIDLKDGRFAFRFWKRAKQMPAASEFLGEYDCAPFDGNPFVMCASATITEVSSQLWCIVLEYRRVPR